MHDRFVVATHPEQTYSNDVERRFRPHSDFWYLTGFAEPRSVLVMDPERCTIFVRPRRKEAEIWTGRRLGVEGAKEALGVDAAYDIEELGTRLPSLLRGARRVHAITEHDPWSHRRLVRHAGKRMTDGAPRLHPHRIIKDRDEVRLLNKAANVGAYGMEKAAAFVATGGSEAAVEGALLGAYRRKGSTGPGYPPIVGAGANATILHYTENSARIRKNDVVLVDAGCEWGYYNSDITRTFPTGRFTRMQERVYDIVLAARQAALAKVRPGNKFLDAHEAAVESLTQGMVDAGFLTGRLEHLVRDKAYRAYYMHGTSHFLGLDVHDVGARDVKLEPGMVLTVEPGLYFNPDFARCPDGTAGIGVRIEDDVLVTRSGRRNLTASLPVALEAVTDMVGP